MSVVVSGHGCLLADQKSALPVFLLIFFFFFNLFSVSASGRPARAGAAVCVRGDSASAQRGRRPRGDDAQLLGAAAN